MKGLKKISKLFNKFNDFLAEKLSLVLSLMITFYVITALTIIPLFYGTPTTLVAWAQYICSVIFQGVALPILGYTAKKAGDKSDKLMHEMYKMTKEIDKLVKQLEVKQEHLDTEMDEILELEKKNHKEI
jgi:Mn2+/Fe2+ NRAMP family transporter